MQEKNTHPIDAEQDLADEINAVLRKISTEIARTPEFNIVKYKALLTFLSGWTGHSMFKKMASGRLVKKLEHDMAEAESCDRTDIRQMAVWENIGLLITFVSRFLVHKGKANPRKTAEFAEEPVRKILSNLDASDLAGVSATSVEHIDHLLTAVFSMLTENREMLSCGLAGMGHLKNYAYRGRHRKSLVLEKYVGSEDGAENAVEICGRLDMAEIGEHINSCVRIVNHLYAQDPDFAPSLMSSLFARIDIEALQKAVQRIVSDLAAAAQPVLIALLPEIINSLRPVLNRAGEDRD
ncbi:MAG: hypothetical protein R6U50_16170 [Desulfobacterales bacterium]